MRKPLHTAYLRKVGGSVMLAVPPAVLDLLHLRSGTKVELGVERNRLIVAPQERPRYTLKELLTQCDPKAPAGKEEREWLDSEAVGRELI